MNPTISLTDKPDPAHVKALYGLLLAFNNAESGFAYDGRPVIVSLTHPESGEVLGGLFGATAYGYLHVDMLFVPESLRHTGVGSRLTQQAEQEAVRRNCHGSYSTRSTSRRAASMSGSATQSSVRSTTCPRATRDSFSAYC